MNNLRVTPDDSADDLVEDWVDDIMGVVIDMDFGGIRTLAIGLIL
jgi:hypothetical protein